MSVPLLAWVVTLAVLAGLVVLDFTFLSRKPHDPSFREALGWSIFYILAAVMFGGIIWWTLGSTAGSEYYAAYIVERSLSIDNLFVFAIILTQFAVPGQLRHRVLLIGIILALLLRAIFIAAGVGAVSLFSFTFVIFGIMLIWTGVQLARHHDEDPEPEDSFVIKQIEKRIPFTMQYHEASLFVVHAGRRVATPLLVAMIAIGFTDILFALDSIPATFGVTTQPFLIFTANAFALLGMTSLYFLLKGLLDKLVYLSLGLSVILIFIGVKLILTYAGEHSDSVPEISTNFSLAFIAGVLAIVGVASWLKVRSDPQAKAHVGRLTEDRDPSDNDDPWEPEGDIVEEIDNN